MSVFSARCNTGRAKKIRHGLGASACVVSGLSIHRLLMFKLHWFDLSWIELDYTTSGHCQNSLDLSRQNNYRATNQQSCRTKWLRTRWAWGNESRGSVGVSMSLVLYPCNPIRRIHVRFVWLWLTLCLLISHHCTKPLCTVAQFDVVTAQHEVDDNVRYSAYCAYNSKTIVLISVTSTFVYV